jgi:hypothetical protein
MTYPGQTSATFSALKRCIQASKCVSGEIRCYQWPILLYLLSEYYVSTVDYCVLFDAEAMAAEYVAASQATDEVLHFIKLEEDLGISRPTAFPCC